MRRFLLPAFLLLLVAVARGQDLDAFLDNLVSKNVERDAGKAKLDPKRLINESNSFLKEREPDMTAEEYAIYEQVQTMLGNNPQFALNLLQNIVGEKTQPSPAFAFILGNTLYAAGQVDEAEKRYREAVDRFPSFVRAWVNLGILYYAAGRHSDAIPCLATAISLGDHHPAILGLLGCCLEREGDTVAAQNAFLQALAGDPRNLDWQEGLLRVYVTTRQHGPAETIVRSLIKAHPSESRYWLTYANILLTANRRPEAVVLLEAARATGAAGPDELTLLGDLYAERGLGAEALAVYQQVLAQAQPRGEARLLRYARALLASGKAAEAERALEAMAASVSPAVRSDFLITRSDALAARKDWAGVRRDTEAILATDPLHGGALLRLGRAHLARDDWAQAQLAFEAADRVPESRYHASLELANLDLRQHQYPKAAEHLERALAIERSDAVADLLQQVQALLAAQ